MTPGDDWHPFPNRIEKFLNAEHHTEGLFEGVSRVRVNADPFKDFEGTVDEVLAAKGQVRVIVRVFGRLTPIDLDHSQIETV